MVDCNWDRLYAASVSISPTLAAAPAPAKVMRLWTTRAPPIKIVIQVRTTLMTTRIPAAIPTPMASLPTVTIRPNKAEGVRAETSPSLSSSTSAWRLCSNDCGRRNSNGFTIDP